jgi:hypothetical protein
MHGSPWSKIVGNAEGMALPTYGNRPAASNRIAQIGAIAVFAVREQDQSTSTIWRRADPGMLPVSNTSTRSSPMIAMEFPDWNPVRSSGAMKAYTPPQP